MVHTVAQLRDQLRNWLASHKVSHKVSSFIYINTIGRFLLLFLILFLDGHPSGRCSWEPSRMPVGWPSESEFRNPSRIRKSELINIINSLSQGKFFISLISYHYRLNFKVVCESRNSVSNYYQFIHGRS